MESVFIATRLLMTNLSSITDADVISPDLETSKVFEEIQNEQLNKLKDEVSKYKSDLTQISQKHHDEIDNFNVILKKVKTERDCIGFIKDENQRKSIKQIKIDYDKELKEINNKSQQTQHGHIAELNKYKKKEIKYKLEIKLKDKKIKELNEENKDLIAYKLEIENKHKAEFEKIKKKYDDKIVEISQLNEDKDELMEQLYIKQIVINDKKQKNDAMEQELQIKDEEINSLKEKIKELKDKNENDHDMFFKHNEIFEYKLQRTVNEKKILNEKLSDLEDVYKKEIIILNDKIIKLKQEISEENNINIHLQQNLDMVFEENKRLKDMENGYQLFVDHIESDYNAMNKMLEDLENKNKTKEKELNKVRISIKAKENENKSLKTSINSHNERINTLESTLKGFETKDEELNKVKMFMTEKENENKTLRTSIHSHNQTIIKLESMLKGLETNAVINEEEEDIKTMEQQYSTSYIRYNVEDKIHLKHVEELKSIEMEYNKLINTMKNELIHSQQLLQETEDSKIKLLTHFGAEMDRMRDEIRKQNELNVLIL